MLTVAEYGSMIADEVRTNAYVEALKRHVKPGSVVVDVGAGTGILSLVACKLGASRVHAIEPNPAIQLLHEHARRNGFSDRIVVHPESAAAVSLPERADVLVSDLRGSTPLYGAHLDVIRDARARFLREGGAQIPLRDELRIALVDSDATRQHVLRGTDPCCGLDLGAAAEWVLDAEHHFPPGVGPECRLSSLSTWAVLDYTSASVGQAVEGAATLVTQRSGTIHGFELTFRATLTEGVGYDAGWGGAKAYRPIFLPLREPVRADAGATFEVDLTAHATERGFVLSWATVPPVGARQKQSNYRMFASSRRIRGQNG